MQIARFAGNKGKWRTLEISTIKCGPFAFAIRPYETAISWPRRYKQGQEEWVIVAAYDTEEEARAGHADWVKIMLKTPPDKLVDCCNFAMMAARRDKGLLSLSDLVAEAREDIS
jgi:hypothetical protein